MGASESSLSTSLRPEDQITTVSERMEGADPILERLKSLKIGTPILTMSPSESSLTDLLVRKPSTSSVHRDKVPLFDMLNLHVCMDKSRKICRTIGTLNPKAVLELFSLYRDWQEAKIHKISQRQEEIENKIDVADALAAKLLQRFNYSVSSMKTTSQHLFGVHALQVEIGELKGRLTEVISNCDALCKRISLTGPESLQSSIKPFSAATANLRKTSDPSTGVLSLKQPSGEVDED